MDYSIDITDLCYDSAGFKTRANQYYCLSLDYTDNASKFLSSKDKPLPFDLVITSRTYTIYNVLGHNQMLKCAFTDNQAKQFFNDNLSLSEGMYDILKKARRKKSKVTLT